MQPWTYVQGQPSYQPIQSSNIQNVIPFLPQDKSIEFEITPAIVHQFNDHDFRIKPDHSRTSVYVWHSLPPPPLAYNRKPIQRVYHMPYPSTPPYPSPSTYDHYTHSLPTRSTSPKTSLVTRANDGESDGNRELSLYEKIRAIYGDDVKIRSEDFDIRDQ